MKPLKQLLIILLASVFFQACNEDSSEESSNGQVKFTFGNISNSSESGRISADNPFAVLLTISDQQGNVILEKERLEVAKFGEGYVSSPLTLQAGNYLLTEFLVVNDQSEVIYAAPIEGTILATLVSNPLPLSFEVGSNEVSDVSVQVISTEGFEAADFGYAVFNFDLIEINHIMVGALLQDENGAYQMIPAELNVFANNSFLYSINLPDSIISITINSSVSQILLQFNYQNMQEEILVTGDSLEIYQNEPLTAIFRYTATMDLDMDLIAYYPFNNGGMDESGNGHHAQMYDVEIVEDRFGGNDKAGRFNGYSSYMNLGVLDSSGIPNQDFAVSFWIKMDEYAPGIHGVIMSNRKRESSNSTVSGKLISVPGEYYHYNTTDSHIYGKAVVATGAGYLSKSANSYDQIPLEQWNHVVVSCKYQADSSFVDFYINGELDSKRSFTGIVNSPTQPTYVGWEPITNIPNDYHLNADLDEIRIYGRVLTSVEVQQLYNQSGNVNY